MPSLLTNFQTVAPARVLALIATCLLASLAAGAQTESSKNTTLTSSQAIQPVTTTVVVQGHVADDYLPTTLSVGNLNNIPLLSAPVSATEVTRDLMTDQFSRTLADVVKNDASIGEDYAPVGYYGDFQIRGFTIDLATGLQINGMTIAGEQDVPLENKERVELLKGIAGVESGVTAAGGVINYVTKRPALIKTLETATDHRGTAYGALDLGKLFGTAKQFGMRVNLAGESIKSYVQDANGWRTAGAAAADWKLTPTTILKGDFEYQHKVQRSVDGYQLLGGAIVPDLNQIYPSVMLGQQAWSKPNTFDTHNSDARIDQDLGSNWKAFAAASYSRSLIDDNVVYAYGSQDENGNSICSNAPNAPGYFFCPDGTYSIYDYRDPRELRIDAQAEAIVTGYLKTGPISQDITGGGVLFRRSVQQPGAPPVGASDNVQDGAVYTYVGSENIYQSINPVPIEIDPITGTPDQAGPQTLYEDDHQASALIQDRVHLPGRIALQAGGRYDSLRDHNYSGGLNTDKNIWLPQYSATWMPTANTTLYGNYSVMLSLGPQAPFWTNNSSVYLAPFFTRQAEVGAKYEPGQRILLTTALFRMRAPFFYPRLIQAPDAFCSDGVTANTQCFESDGRETHNGIEAGAQGKVASWLRLSATSMGIHAISGDSETPSYNGRQVINVPRFKIATFADVAMSKLPGFRGSDFHLLPGWSYSGRKEATRDDAVSVAGYNLFSLGARYTPGGEQGRVTFRLFADNILDKRYWKDTGASYGDTFLHFGAPTTVRLSGVYRF